MLQKRRNERLHGEIDVLAFSRRERLCVRGKRRRRRCNATLEITLLTEGLEWREIGAIGRAGAQPRPAAGMAANVPGKARQMINYPLGVPDYLAQWREAKQSGYAGFDIR